MKPFGVQMFASLGVRKDERNEQELGEDATGLVIKNNHAVIWVADGATGVKIKANIKHEGLNFNSRVLAKYLGRCFENMVFKCDPPKTQLDEAFYEDTKNALQSALSVRLESIRKYLSQNKNSISTALFAKETKGDEVFYSFEWSATFVGAVIDTENESCSTISIGDGVAIVDDIPISNRLNRVFVSWYISEDFESSHIEIASKKPRIEEVDNMKSVILMSDGVINGNALNEFERNLEGEDSESIWNELKNMNTITDDDKIAIRFTLMG